MSYYLAKGKLKLFYEEALKFLAYTSPEEINEKEKIDIVVNMGITCLCSP